MQYEFSFPTFLLIAQVNSFLIRTSSILYSFRYCVLWRWQGQQSYPGWRTGTLIVLCIWYFWDTRLMSESRACCIDITLIQFVLLTSTFVLIVLVTPATCFRLTKSRLCLWYCLRLRVLTGMGCTLRLMCDICCSFWQILDRSMSDSSHAFLNLHICMMHCTVIWTRDLRNVILVARSSLVVHDLKYWAFSVVPVLC
jgi:hypothetical protein